MTGKQGPICHLCNAAKRQQLIGHLCVANSLAHHNHCIASQAEPFFQAVRAMEQLFLLVLLFDAFVQTCNAFHTNAGDLE